jgi:hypothetical protein
MRGWGGDSTRAKRGAGQWLTGNRGDLTPNPFRGGTGFRERLRDGTGLLCFWSECRFELTHWLIWRWGAADFY